MIGESEDTHSDLQYDIGESEDRPSDLQYDRRERGQPNTLGETEALPVDC